MRSYRIWRQFGATATIILRALFPLQIGLLFSIWDLCVHAVAALLSKLWLQCQGLLLQELRAFKVREFRQGVHLQGQTAMFDVNAGIVLPQISLHVQCFVLKLTCVKFLRDVWSLHLKSTSRKFFGFLKEHRTVFCKNYNTELVENY